MAGSPAAILLIGYRLNCLRFTIFVQKFSTINISFNLYMILNFYKSYTTDNLYVRSTAVHVVTAGQPDGDLDGGGYLNIPLKVEVFILPRKIVLSYTNDFLPVKVGVTRKNWQKKRAELIRSNDFVCISVITFLDTTAHLLYILIPYSIFPSCFTHRYVSFQEYTI